MAALDVRLNFHQGTEQRERAAANESRELVAAVKSGSETADAAGQFMRAVRSARFGDQAAILSDTMRACIAVLTDQRAVSAEPLREARLLHSDGVQANPRDPRVCAHREVMSRTDRVFDVLYSGCATLSRTEVNVVKPELLVDMLFALSAGPFRTADDRARVARLVKDARDDCFTPSNEFKAFDQARQHEVAERLIASPDIREMMGRLLVPPHAVEFEHVLRLGELVVDQVAAAYNLPRLETCGAESGGPQSSASAAYAASAHAALFFRRGQMERMRELLDEGIVPTRSSHGLLAGPLVPEIISAACHEVRHAFQYRMAAAIATQQADGTERVGSGRVRYEPSSTFPYEAKLFSIGQFENEAGMPYLSRIEEVDARAFAGDVMEKVAELWARFRR